MDKKNLRALGIKEFYHKEPQNRFIKKKELSSILDCKNLEELREELEKFNGCDLKFQAKNTVFADGVPDAKIVLVGEAPGEEEDQKAIPFCGQSGRLLRKAMASIGLTTDKNLYITNSVFWRPPANRKPTREEIEVCRPFLEKHLALLKPSLIVLIGATALEALLKITKPITGLRGQYFDYSNPFLEGRLVKATVLFHPSYLLRQGSQKKAFWFDLLKIKEDWLE